MENRKYINVYYHNILVGILAETKEGLVAFEYSSEFLNNGFSISPLSLPLEKRLFIPKDYNTFQGLFGVFNDSLPDGWGRLIVDRFLKSKGINIGSINVLDRLAIAGDYCMGALEYKPAFYEISIDNSIYDLDILSNECLNLLKDRECNNIDELFNLSASSGGARPKVLVKYNNQQWIIKFRNHSDMEESGVMEYEYNSIAKECGIEVPEFKLFPSKYNGGYFGVKRFDREDNKKIHMISSSALLETSHRIYNLDYNILLKLTKKITKSMEEVKKMFKLMVFNIFSHNRDDHAKNFSFIYNENEKVYKLSPAYDLTYSNSYNFEHACMVNGKGNNITDGDILEVAKINDIDIKFAKQTIKIIEENTKILKKYEQ